jgi:Outer membrane lipoprotein carrier protein LolA-like
MRRRRLLLSLATVLPAVAVRAQFQGVAKGEVLRGRFTQERQLKGFDRPLISSGNFALAPGLGLIWRTEHPFAVVTLITAAGLVQEVDGTETTRLAATRVPFLARLYDLLGAALLGDWQVLDRQFQVTRHGDPRQWDLTLVPLAGADPLTVPFRSVTLHGGKFLDEVRIVRLDDDADRLAFSGQTLSGGGLSEADAGLLRRAGK